MSALPFDLSGKVPLCTLANLRTLLGRSAVRTRLISALDSSTGSLQWAANHYKRDQFSESASSSSSSSSSVDAEPQMPSSSQIHAGGSFRSKFTSWPFELVMIVASFVDEFRDLISFSSCNKQLRHAIISDKHYVEVLWSTLLESNRYSLTLRNSLSDHLVLVGGTIVHGTPASLSFHVKPCAPTESAFVQFQSLWQKECNRDCPACSAKASIVPSIYGFPSPYLLDLFRKKKLVFGGDNLVDGLACWACLSCREEYYACPWTCGIIRCGGQDQTVGRARYQGRHALPWSFGDSAKK